MVSNNDKAIKKLRDLEARAELLEAQASGIRNECHLTRRLLEGDVSTSSKKGNPSAAVAKAMAGRKAFLNKKNRHFS
jgi:hypothetical protein